MKQSPTTYKAMRRDRQRVRHLSKALRRHKERSRRQMREALRNERGRQDMEMGILTRLQEENQDELIDRVSHLQAKLTHLETWKGFLRHKMGRA